MPIISTPQRAELAARILSEGALAASEVARRLPSRRGGKKVHASSVVRWMVRGFKGVNLGYVKIGGVRCTSMAEVARFLATVTALECGEAPPEPPRDAERRRRAASAGAEVASIGRKGRAGRA